MSATACTHAASAAAQALAGRPSTMTVVEPSVTVAEAAFGVGDGVGEAGCGVTKVVPGGKQVGGKQVAT